MRIHGHRFRGAVGRRITRCGHHHDGRWRSFALNKGAELIFGYTAAEALGRSIIELIVPGLPSSGGLGARRQRACYQLCRIPVRTAACQPEQPARSGRQKIYAAEKVAHRCAKGRLVPLIQSVQEAVEQDRRSASSGGGGNEVHVVFLTQASARMRLCASRDRTYRGFSTSFRPAPRKLCGARENAKGCRANLAKAEGLKLPSPRELHHTTAAARRTGPRAYIIAPPVVTRPPPKCDNAHTTSRISGTVPSECEFSRFHCRPGTIRSIDLPGAAKFDSIVFRDYAGPPLPAHRKALP
jgi:hypothetical protein